MTEIEKVKEDIEDRISGLRDELTYNPWFFLNWRTEHIRQQTAYTDAQRGKIIAWVQMQQDLTLLKDRYEHVIELEKKTFEAQVEAAIVLVEIQQLNQKLIDLASNLGIDLINYGLVRKEQLLDDLAAVRERRQSDLKVEEHRRMEETKDEFADREVVRQLKAAIAYQHLNFEHAKHLTNDLMKLEREKYDLFFSGKPIQWIEAQLKHLNVLINGIEAQCARLLQGDNQKDLQGGDENPVRRGFLESHMAEGQE